MPASLLVALLTACAPDDADPAKRVAVDIHREADCDAPATFHADSDADGFGDAQTGIFACASPAGMTADATDCDDTRADTFPGAAETCNAADDDCDGDVDEDAIDAGTVYLDADGDGYGDAGTARASCEELESYVSDATDCDDADALVHPGADESDCADFTDYNCDGSVAWADLDADGWAACQDCDDTDAGRNPGAAEICDGAVDEDCDTLVDDDDDVSDAAAWYRDADADGWGNDALTTTACAEPAGFAAVGGDCDDSDAWRSPGLPEVCDAADLDEDCSGTADDADVGTDAATFVTFARDADVDGYGNATRTVSQCDAPAGYVVDATDCDDADPDVSPGDPEVCDAADVDEDCDGLADDLDPNVTGETSWYADADADGFGGTSTLSACVMPVGYLATTGDCDDGDAGINTGGTEVCDGDDDDCDGIVDDGVTTTYYADADGDGWGDPDVKTEACAVSAGFVTNALDCDDADARFPDATGACVIPDTADTASTPSPVRFVVLGDTGDGSLGQYEVAHGMEIVCAAEGCDFALLVGDNFYPAGVTSTTDPLWSSAFELPYAGLDMQFRAVMGNHDWGHTLDTLYLDAQVDYTAVSTKWYMPADYYTFTEGDVTFYGIDTHVIDQGAGAAQEAWLPVERASSSTTWNLVYGHHPYLSNGPHGNADPNVENFFDSYVCGEYDVYFCGHDHNLQWLEDSCGTAFLVSGGGKSTYPLGGTNPVYFEAESTGFLWVEIDGRTFTGVFYDQDGVELFRRSITK